MDIRSQILDQFSQVAQEQGRPIATLDDALELQQTGLDSLSFAIIVVRLEGSLGVDPFNTHEDMPFPVTFGDFVRCYEKASE
jgi:acyl carrier protein